MDEIKTYTYGIRVNPDKPLYMKSDYPTYIFFMDATPIEHYTNTFEFKSTQRTPVDDLYRIFKNTPNIESFYVVQDNIRYEIKYSDIKEQLSQASNRDS
jgi:hypothetical protein